MLWFLNKNRLHRYIVPQHVENGQINGLATTMATCFGVIVFTGNQYMAGTLAVATFDYLPYVFFNLINPVVALVFAFMNIKITRLS